MLKKFDNMKKCKYSPLILFLLGMLGWKTLLSALFLLQTLMRFLRNQFSIIDGLVGTIFFVWWLSTFYATIKLKKTGFISAMVIGAYNAITIPLYYVVGTPSYLSNYDGLYTSFLSNAGYVDEGFSVFKIISYVILFILALVAYKRLPKTTKKESSVI